MSGVVGALFFPPLPAAVAWIAALAVWGLGLAVWWITVVTLLRRKRRRATRAPQVSTLPAAPPKPVDPADAFGIPSPAGPESVPTSAHRGSVMLALGASLLCCGVAALVWWKSRTLDGALYAAGLYLAGLVLGAVALYHGLVAWRRTRRLPWLHLAFVIFMLTLLPAAWLFLPAWLWMTLWLSWLVPWDLAVPLGLLARRRGWRARWVIGGSLAALLLCLGLWGRGLAAALWLAGPQPASWSFDSGAADDETERSSFAPAPPLALLGEGGLRDGARLLVWAGRDCDPSELRAAGAHAVPALCSLLRLRHDDSRCAAASLLGELKDSRAVEPLIQALRDDLRGGDPSFGFHLSVAFALGELGDPRAVEMLVLVLQGDGGNIWPRIGAAIALGKLGDQRAVWPLIQTFWLDPSVEVQSSAAHALKRLHAASAIEFFVQALQSPAEPLEKHIRASAALGLLGDARAVGPLIQALRSDPAPEVRRVAAEALGQLGDLRAVEPLLEALEREEAARFEILSGERSGVLSDAAISSITYALGRLAGQELKGSPAWRQWWEANRARLLQPTPPPAPPPAPTAAPVSPP